ncbi:MAG TPA: LysM peptidoglycan-binding domain-containing protein [Gemmatimonadales bacterium]|nr:LysM peptidoglycan-binding domain-containing protein [Gemmatimonadales bacterium]
MKRFGPFLLVCAAYACGGRQRAPETPAPAAQQQEPPPEIASDAADTTEIIPPAPVLFSHVDSELAEALRIAADSAADEAMLEQLFADLPDSLSSEGEEGVEATPGGTAAASGAVTFDIAVEKFNTHSRVQYYLNFFRGMAKERFAIWLGRMPRYEAMIRRRLQQEGLPSDLVYLALIESGFSNSATSRARAVGMWQFMKGTGKYYGLRVDRWVDERRDPYQATDAAARHLKDLTNRFGSHYLAAAAYNAGAGRVSRGLVRLPEDDSDSLPSDATFFRLYDTKLLRRETKDYVPKLIAAAMIAKDPTRYGFPPLPPPDTGMQYDSLMVEGMTSFDVLARLADTTIAALRELNPQYLRLATPPSGTWIVRVPVGRGGTTADGYAALPASERVTFREHRVRSGETMSGLARRYGVGLDDLRAANPRIRSTKLRPGQLVIVPTQGPILAEVARQVSAPDQSEATWHRVRRGETLSSIARRYHVAQRQLQNWNGMGRSTRIRAGQRLRVSSSESAPRAGGKSRRPATQTAATAGEDRSHVVRKGDTLTGLARRYGVTIQALREANDLEAGEVLKSGVRLRIPV